MPKNKDKNKKKKDNKHLGIYDPANSLKGKELRKLARRLTTLQTRAPARAYTRQANSLRDVLSDQIASQLSLGKQATTNVAGFYNQLAQAEAQNLARQEALGARLRADVGTAGTQAQEGIQSAGEAGVQRLDEDALKRLSTPSRARDELQQMIAQQQGFAAQNQQGLNATAAGQSADWESAMGVLAQANQMRGGQNLTDIQREVVNRISELQQSFTPDIKGALGQAADVRASRGDIRAQLLRQLTGEEREFGLSKAALGLDKRALKQEGKLARKSLRAEKQGKTGQTALVEQYKDLARLKSRLSRRGMSLSHSQNKELARLKAQISKRNINLSQGGGKNGGKLSLGEKVRDEYSPAQRAAAKNYVQRQFKHNPDVLRDPKLRQKFIDKLQHSEGQNPLLTKWAIQKVLNRGPKFKRTKTERGQRVR